jgi:hypothetical protein
VPVGKYKQVKNEIEPVKSLDADLECLKIVLNVVKIASY